MAPTVHIWIYTSSKKELQQRYMVIYKTIDQRAACIAQPVIYISPIIQYNLKGFDIAAIYGIQVDESVESGAFAENFPELSCIPGLCSKFCLPFDRGWICGISQRIDRAYDSRPECRDARDALQALRSCAVSQDVRNLTRRNRQLPSVTRKQQILLKNKGT